MLYKDDELMPSEIMQALAHAYEKEEENSRQKKMLLVENFFATSERTKLSFMSLTDLPNTLVEQVNRIVKTIDEWQYNISCIFNHKTSKINTQPLQHNLFGCMSSLGECERVLFALYKLKPHSPIDAYVTQASHLQSTTNDLLAQKSIAIRRYL